MSCAMWPAIWPTGQCPPNATAADTAVRLATSLLRSLSGGQYGPCTYLEDYATPGGSSCGPVGPYKDAQGSWRNGTRATCCKLHLASQPATSIEAVTVDGVLLDPAGYRLSRGVLYRVGACWPAPLSCDGARIVVEYTAGLPIDELGQAAVGEVAVEYAAALAGQKCRLPGPATTINRQGVSIELGSTTDLAKVRRLGLRVADAWLDSVNPNRLIARSRIFSPDLAQRV